MQIFRAAILISLVLSNLSKTKCKSEKSLFLKVIDQQCSEDGNEVDLKETTKPAETYDVPSVSLDSEPNVLTETPNDSLVCDEEKGKLPGKVKVTDEGYDSPLLITSEIDVKKIKEDVVHRNSSTRKDDTKQTNKVCEDRPTPIPAQAKSDHIEHNDKLFSEDTNLKNISKNVDRAMNVSSIPVDLKQPADLIQLPHSYVSDDADINKEDEEVDLFKNETDDVDSLHGYFRGSVENNEDGVEDQHRYTTHNDSIKFDRFFGSENLNNRNVSGQSDTMQLKESENVVLYEAETVIAAKRLDETEINPSVNYKETAVKNNVNGRKTNTSITERTKEIKREENFKNLLFLKDQEVKDRNSNKSDVNTTSNSHEDVMSKSLVDIMVSDDHQMKNYQDVFYNQEHKREDPLNSCPDCNFGILPVRSAVHRSKAQDSPFTLPLTISEPSLQFADVPLGEDLRVDELGLSEGTFLFSYLGELLSWLQPNDFPIELMRDALRNQISIIDLITQSLKVEAGFIACIVIGVLLALAAPIAVLSHTCFRFRRRKGKGDESDEGPIGWAGNCRRRTLVFILQILIIFLFIGTVAMVITNQQVSTSVLQSGHVLRTVLGDLDTFLHNAHLQLHFAISKHLDQAVQAVNSDLENVEVLLGQPIQAELSKETGVDVALESLRDIAQDASKVGEAVELVQLAAGLVGEAILLSRERLSDLRLQVDSFRRQCSSRDRPLCDTLNVVGLDVTLSVDFLRQDERLKRVRQIGGPELRGAVETARILYRDIPRQVDADTKEARQDVRRQLSQEQAEIDDNIRALDTLVRNLRGKVMSSQNTLDDITVNVPEIEYWRWLIGLGAAGSLTILWLLLQSGISCGCCGSEKSAGPTLLVSVILICLVSTALWTVALVVLLVGGHGQVFVCRPLYQDPEYPALSQLLDQPGLFQGSHKFLSTLAFNNETMDVPLSHVLRECQANKAVYPLLHLKGVFNVDSMAESTEWDELQDKMSSIHVTLDHLKLLSPALQAQLNDLLQGLSVNLTAHRTQLSGLVTGKDLNSFAAQLDSVGNQIKDLATASRMETLASRTRRLIATHIEPLKEKKENLMYQLTALELQLSPLQRQVEQSISHFKTIQFFINNQGNSIANKKKTEYTNRLTRYIDQYRINLSDRVNNNLARCHPLWKLFHTSRQMLCKHIMDPLNGFWFSTIWCLIILLCATPVCLKLVDCYKQKSHAHSAHSCGSPTENLMANEQGREWSSNGNGDSGGGW